ncbi:MAG: hypothetical protein QMD65_01900 [Patescibacteria group bacterium]|nr:hypothetical protein [Patescibacteria group bacterium]
MTKILITSISFILILSLPIKVLGEELTSSSLLIKNLPKPVTDLFQTFGKIKLNITDKDIPFVKKAAESIKKGDLSGLSPEKLGGEVRGFWQKTNTWVQEKLGASLKEIIKSIGNLFVWIFEFIIKLIKTGLSYL